MSYSSPSPPPPSRPGRPRDERREAEILAAVLDLLTDHGFDGVTFEAVARRAGASKPTLYRRWSTRDQMVVAALRAGPATEQAPVDTGSLRGDLLVLVDRLIGTMRRADARAALSLLQAGLHDPELCEAIETSVGPTGARIPPEVLRRAVERGELDADADPFPYDETVGAALLLRRLNGLSTDDAHVVALVDHVVLPGLRSTARRSTAESARPLPAGIFSGHPAPDPATSTAPEETP